MPAFDQFDTEGRVPRLLDDTPATSREVRALREDIADLRTAIAALASVTANAPYEGRLVVGTEALRQYESLRLNPVFKRQ